jgi:hypothetical protein
VPCSAVCFAECLSLLAFAARSVDPMLLGCVLSVAPRRRMRKQMKVVSLELHSAGGLSFAELAEQQKPAHVRSPRSLAHRCAFHSLAIVQWHTAHV